MRVNKLQLLTTSILFVAPTYAFAHPGHGANGWSAGFCHPFTGWDHILVMFAVGIWAIQLGGRSKYLVPLAFVGLMILGGILALVQIPLPIAESGILASVFLMGLILLFSLKFPTGVAAMLAGVFAIFHGYAHGAEMPANSGATAYASGFVLATAVLLCLGAIVGNFLAITNCPQWIRISGGAMTVAAALIAHSVI